MTFILSHKLKEKHNNDISTLRRKVAWDSEALIARPCLYSNRLYFLGCLVPDAESPGPYSIQKKEEIVTSLNADSLDSDSSPRGGKGAYQNLRMGKIQKMFFLILKTYFPNTNYRDSGVTFQAVRHVGNME